MVDRGTIPTSENNSVKDNRSFIFRRPCSEIERLNLRLYTFFIGFQNSKTFGNQERTAKSRGRVKEDPDKGN